ncbi:hypothetical protein [Paraburkholderia sp.]|uniref:hypothetical protein n=1 Tax=Paraburkholderia sp. TaxID=1926495 RepID=UPI002D32CE3C|nr:hypothetical protein [Paraburkholderia sp.]HZZ03563.1 hypothetical protein [Paraburkholderia sp.]
MDDRLAVMLTDALPIRPEIEVKLAGPCTYCRGTGIRHPHQTREEGRAAPYGVAQQRFPDDAN